MKCNDYLPLLSGHLDSMNTAVEEQRLQKHLSACKHCRALLAQMEQTDALLHASKSEPPADLTARIMARVRKESKQKSSHKRTILSISAAGLTAAALLAFVFLGDLKLPSFRQEKDTGALTVNTHSQESEPLAALSTGSADLLQDYAQSPAEQERSTDSKTESMTTLSLTVSEEAPTAPPTYSVPLESPSATEPAADDAEAMQPQLPSLVESAYGSATEPQHPNDFFLGATEQPHYLSQNGETLKTDAPLLILWGARTEDIELLKGLSPVTAAELPEESVEPSAEADSLYECLLASLPLAKKLSEAASDLPQNSSVTKYHVSYEQLSALFSDCVGNYELAIYYPADLRDLENCTVLILSPAESVE